MENRTRQEVLIRIKAEWNAFGKYREIFLDRHLPMSLRRKVINQYVLPAMDVKHGLFKSICTETWNEPCKADRICNTTIRQRTSLTDSPIFVTKAKRKWVEHIFRMKDNSWIIRSTQGQINRLRSVGRSKRRWRDDIVGQHGVVWTRIAKDRESKRTLVEGYSWQWKDTALNRIE